MSGENRHRHGITNAAVIFLRAGIAPVTTSLSRYPGVHWLTACGNAMPDTLALSRWAMSHQLPDAWCELIRWVCNPSDNGDLLTCLAQCCDDGGAAVPCKPVRCDLLNARHQMAQRVSGWNHTADGERTAGILETHDHHSAERDTTSQYRSCLASRIIFWRYRRMGRFSSATKSYSGGLKCR